MGVEEVRCRSETLAEHKMRLMVSRACLVNNRRKRVKLQLIRCVLIVRVLCFYSVASEGAGTNVISKIPENVVVDCFYSALIASLI